MNKESLLSQLRIERNDAPRSPRRDASLPWGWIGAALFLLVTAGTGVWFMIARPDLTRVETAAAKPAWSGAAAQGGSLLDASGYVVARREATVSSKIPGKVVEVLIEEGQRVTAGQVIARLDDSNARASLDQAEAQAAAADTALKVAQVAGTQALPTYQRNQRIHAQGYLSDQAVEDAKAVYDTARLNLELAQRQALSARATVEVYRRALDDTVVRAPFDGVVTAKAAQPGEIVAPVAGGGFTRTGIGTIVDMESLEVEVDVAENFINRVSQGMPASIKLNAYPDWEIPAEVIAVIPTADRSKATVTVRVGFKVKDARIVPEMGAHVAFLSPAPKATAAAASRSVIVPPDAVQTEDGGQAVVFVIEADHAERRAVRLGDKGTEGQIVTAGLAPGEMVAVDGAEHLKDGAGVRIVKRKAD